MTKKELKAEILLLKQRVEELEQKQNLPKGWEIDENGNMSYTITVTPPTEWWYQSINIPNPFFFENIRMEQNTLNAPIITDINYNPHRYLTTTEFI